VLIGILSDTHDHVAAMAAGMATLQAAGAEFIVHCGDVGGERILDLLAGTPSAFVWGNCDVDRDELAGYAAKIGVDCRGEFADLELGGKKIAVTHGDDLRHMRVGMAGAFDYLLHGHTHVVRDQRAGGVRIINPGALHRAATKTVAVLDTEKDVLRFLTVEI
jgi:uncharacterized protein